MQAGQVARLQRSDQERSGQLGIFAQNILLRKGRLKTVVNGHDQFIREAVLPQGYIASEVAKFLCCQLLNVSCALQKT